MWVKKGQNGWNFLPRSLQPFPLISACGSRCGSSTILEAFQTKQKPRRPQSYGVFLGAAIQIRTGDLILTNTLRCVQAVLSGTVWAFFVPIWVVYNGIPPTVSTQFFRVWVRVWVKRQNSKQKPRAKGLKVVLKICVAKQRRQLSFVSVKRTAADASYGAQLSASESSLPLSAAPKIPAATPTAKQPSRINGCEATRELPG